jgi:ubiquinol-cytochrome c reductase cytochrome b subunit
MITKSLFRALDARLRLAPVVRRAFTKVFPDHWSFMFGEIALYSFVVLVLTGVVLTLFFEPSIAEKTYRGGYQPLNGARLSAAYASTVALSFDIRSGLLLRQTHHWAALIFLGAIVLHLLRIFSTGAFRRPREINWLIGVTMLTLALLNGFSGYSMPDDLLSGTGLRIIYSVVESTPVIGEWLVFLLFGGEFPAELTVPRLYVSHVLIVPGLLAALITLHLTIIVRQKHTQFPGPGCTEHNVVGSRLWPGYTARTLALFAWVLAVLFALGGLFQINPVWLYGPFDPAQVTSPAQPDWYVAWGDGALRLFPPLEFRVFGHLVPSPFLPGAGLGAVAFLILYAWPFLETWRTGDREAHQLLDQPRGHPARLGIGVGTLVFFTVLVVAAGDDVIARILGIPVSGVLLTLRILVLTLPWVAGLAAFLWARALKIGGAEGITDLTRANARSALRRPRPPTDTRGQTTPAEQRETRPATVQLWTSGDGTWQWRYAERDRPIVLTSHETFVSRDDATDAARRAYPGVPLHQMEPPAGVLLAAPERQPGPGARLLAAAAWLVLLIIGRRRRRE